MTMYVLHYMNSLLQQPNSESHQITSNDCQRNYDIFTAPSMKGFIINIYHLILNILC